MIEICNMTKSFGSETVLRDVSAVLETGKIYGLVGRNGSGKTVLLKLLCGLLLPDSGEIRIDGAPLGSRSPGAWNMGVLIERPGFLPRRTALQNLRLLAAVNRRVGEEAIRKAIRTVGLDPDSKKKVGDFSLGMRQRLGIAQAIMEGQKILLLDEPFSGVDAQSLPEMRELLRAQRGPDRTILIATHVREDIDGLCDQVFSVHGGALELLS